MTTAIDRVSRYVREHRDHFEKQLIEFCAIPSVTSDRESSRLTVEYLADYMRSLGLMVKTIDTEGNPLIVSSSDPMERPGFAYYSHYDVVPARSDEGWEADPFDVTERDGRLFGRGVADHKGWLLSRLQGLEVLRQLGLQPQRSIEFLIEGDEEQGSGPLTRLVEAGGIQLAAGIVLYSGWQRLADGSPRINGGGRGVLEIEVTLENAREVLHGSYAPLVSHPLTQLTGIIAKIVGANGEVAVPGFYDDAGAPSEKDLEALQTVPFDLNGERQRIGFHRLNGVFGSSSNLDALKQLYFRPIAYPQSFSVPAGSSATVPTKASCVLKFSLVPGQNPEKIFEAVRSEIERIAELPVSFELLKAIPPARTSLDSPGFELLRSACIDWSGTTPITIPFSSGSGPRSLFIEDLGKDLLVDVGVSHVGSNDHGPDENIFVQHYLDGIVHAASTMLRADDLP